MPDYPQHDDHDASLMRASIPGRPSGLLSRASAIAILAPGRAWLECSIILSALTMLVPALACGAFVCAVMARRSDNPRATAALLASVWCGMLGLGLRTATGIGYLP